jgi:crotonobetainyl-CoA:carnitine CoA-transferase CaiB-like acyl-CoA transferase
VPGLQIADTSSAIIAAFSIMAALFGREKSGNGSHIDVPMLNSTLSFIGMHIAKSSLNENHNNLLHGTVPCYNLYKTKDGRHTSLGAIENKFWESFCKSVSREDMATKQFDSSMMNEMRVIFGSRTLEQWVKLNEKYDFCCEPVKSIKEVLIDKRLSNVLVKLGGLMHVAMPVNFSQIGRIKYLKSPELGEHTVRLLSSLGYSKKSVVKLKKMNVAI